MGKITKNFRKFSTMIRGLFGGKTKKLKETNQELELKIEVMEAKVEEMEGTMWNMAETILELNEQIEVMKEKEKKLTQIKEAFQAGQKRMLRRQKTKKRKSKVEMKLEQIKEEEEDEEELEEFGMVIYSGSFFAGLKTDEKFDE
jgi:chromosome segregation ATPase